ncbi:MAG: hypothetical protein DHS20C21_10440 [Gemmatimonadota bacterium]|nr:MAG: hypothetical protein DHS20C21_10440 [Gemmatimonadota bacterium]
MSSFRGDKRRETVVRFAVMLMVLLGAQDLAAENLCLGPSKLGHNLTVDCDPVSPIAHENGWVGFSTDAQGTCETGNNCSPHRAGCFCSGFDYTWSISSSATDPHVNQGALPDTLYLWVHCAAFDGVFAAEFGLQGTVGVMAFDPMNGFSNLGTAEDLLLLAPPTCPTPNLLVGRITVEASTSIARDPAMRTWGAAKSLYR